MRINAQSFITRLSSKKEKNYYSKGQNSANLPLRHMHRHRQTDKYRHNHTWAHFWNHMTPYIMQNSSTIQKRKKASGTAVILPATSLFSSFTFTCFPSFLSTLPLPSPTDCPGGLHLHSMPRRQTHIPHPAQYRCHGCFCRRVCNKR